MSQYLVSVALGPVQEFIANARRTRDLWFGSHLLSELSRGVARALAQQDFMLIFPALQRGEAELEPCGARLRDSTGAPPLAISNVILALSPDISSEDLRTSVAGARSAALDRCRSAFAERAAARELGPLLRDGGREKILTALDELLECTAAWVPWPERENSEGVRIARRRLASLLHGRKTLRDFALWRGQAGLPKSSPDGFRETVFRDDLQSGAENASGRQHILDTARRYRIPLAEHLDGIGAIKRAGGNPTHFVPLARITLAEWIEAIADAEAERAGTGQRSNRFHAFQESLRGLVKSTTLAQIGRVPETWTERFPYDAEVFLEDQWKNHTLLKRAGSRVLATAAVDREAERAYAKFTETEVGPLLKHRTPDPYIACLVADGDRMGKALETCAGIAGLRKVSKALGRFAGDARAVVNEHRGRLVYAGGDDVLAFLPVRRALDAASALVKSFAGRMGEAFPEVDVASRPTLSVGIGLGHLLKPMGELLELGREAESLAKRGSSEFPVPENEERNALAVLSERRGGGRAALRERWCRGSKGIPEPARTTRALTERVRAFLEGEASHGLAYEVGASLRRMPDPTCLPQASHSQWAEILTTELCGLLVRKRYRGAIAGERASLYRAWQRLGFCLEQPSPAENGTSPDSLMQARGRRWVEESLVIRHFALAQRSIEKARGGAR